MNSKVESGEYRLDGLKWLVVFLLIGAGVFANSFYQDEIKLLYRVFALIALAGVCCFIAFNTAKGNAAWNLFKDAQIEVRKVVWPTNAETNQTTLLVAVVVIITAIILWILDWAIGHLAKLVIG
ncbi:preprotein translocase subunit SecE [Saccharophagus sp. K07]|uniref:preprotein translocase subunit SecE n=1 Tax=Saccharophagus sp. K07 TaxID=2283636 RepID=UPI0016526099|nr:preprotein translocase subunit SecE [Saccharophagus sp. K07]MBC6906577.1 preprotein translocase subunit SecE [Saccharophagus sp. K07]